MSIEVIQGLLIFFAVLILIYGAIRLNRRISDDVKHLVVQKFMEKGYKVNAIEDAAKNPQSPFYKDVIVTPSTGSFNLFKSRFYKIALEDKDGRQHTRWVHCLYFITYECFFTIKE